MSALKRLVQPQPQCSAVLLKCSFVLLRAPSCSCAGTCVAASVSEQEEQLRVVAGAEAEVARRVNKRGGPLGDVWKGGFRECAIGEDLATHDAFTPGGTEDGAQFLCHTRQPGEVDPVAVAEQVD